MSGKLRFNSKEKTATCFYYRTYNAGAKKNGAGKPASINNHIQLVELLGKDS